MPNQQGRTLYVGNLHPYVTDNILQTTFAALGYPTTDAKVVLDRATKATAGYGFVRFADANSAAGAMASATALPPLFGQVLRVNWAFQRGRDKHGAGVQVFVGDLSGEVTDESLLAAFMPASAVEARVMWDHLTGRSKGYGFVTFPTRDAAEAAIEKLNGIMLGTRKIRLGWAAHKQPEPDQLDAASVDHTDPLNANVYVGNLAPGVSDPHLRARFEEHGPVLEMRVYRKGLYAFVQFEHHADAVRAIVAEHGQQVNGKALRCSWGRHPPRRDPESAAVAAANLAMLQHTYPLQQYTGSSLMVPSQIPPPLHERQRALQQPGPSSQVPFLQAGMAGLQLSPSSPQHAHPPPGQQQHTAALLLAAQHQQQQSLGMLPYGYPYYFFPPGPQ